MSNCPLPRIAVLLSTYNGERYLTEQLDSLFQQTHRDFVLVVRDDGSKDGTVPLLESLCAGQPQPMVLVKDREGNLGACQSFHRLLGFVLNNQSSLGLSRAYMAFCDQDDVWDPDKLQVSLEHLIELETEQGTPALVHTDLRVVNAALDPIADSLVAYQGLQPLRRGFGRILVANAVTGCTAMFNEALARKALPIPEDAVMHDWWLALVAGAFGETAYIDRATVSYRQHGFNTVGAKKHSLNDSYNLHPLSRLFYSQNAGVLASTGKQAKLLHEQYRAVLKVRNRMLCYLAGALNFGIAPWKKLVYWLIRRF